MKLSQPPRRSRLLLALGLSVALLSATLIGFDRSTSRAEQADSKAASADAGKSADKTNSDDTADNTASSDTTDTTAGATTTTSAGAGAGATTTTTPAGNGNDGNINNLPLHDGSQKGGVFNPTPYGEIPANTPQVVVQRPGSGRVLALNQEIQISAMVQNFQPGFFNDPKTQYGVDPQRLNSQGNLQGHNHACIQRLPANGLPGTKCDSFVVLEQQGATNVVSGVGPPVTVPGRYRVCVDDAAGAHYVAVRAFAQQGGPVDCVRVLFMGQRR